MNGGHPKCFGSDRCIPMNPRNECGWKRGCLDEYCNGLKAEKSADVESPIKIKIVETRKVGENDGRRKKQ